MGDAGLPPNPGSGTCPRWPQQPRPPIRSACVGQNVRPGHTPCEQAPRDDWRQAGYRAAPSSSHLPLLQVHGDVAPVDGRADQRHHHPDIASDPVPQRHTHDEDECAIPGQHSWRAFRLMQHGANLVFLAERCIPKISVALRGVGFVAFPRRQVRNAMVGSPSMHPDGRIETASSQPRPIRCHVEPKTA